MERVRQVGAVALAGFAAVKGTAWRPRASLRLTGAGVEGDRRWCFVDVEARQVLRTVSHPGLLELEVRDEDAGLPVVHVPTGERAEGGPVPTGETLTCDYWGRAVPLALHDGAQAALASLVLGRDVVLAQAPPSAIVYAGGVSLVSTASCRAVGVDPVSVRASLVLDLGDEPFTEAALVGREVRLGSGAVVRPTAETTRCAVLGADALRRLTALRGALLLGVDGDVLAPGEVRPGDPVTVDGGP
ncbi:MOSC domain-containing protein [Nocardioides sp. GY 10127]|uniref:MOSC domain-containing protein n=1 Tax=Nocardioides sp. GY 10127 TaxID=2569762 RepID=UPI0010A7BB63|nr:MOSC domain-containing protein [Nocardioides sp. GY 10127]TIC82919.1 hypothetical protein E8D37_09725 [Nocardioides sp. GY 10127]